MKKMKRINRWIIAAVIAAVGIVIGFDACDNDGGNEEQLIQQKYTTDFGGGKKIEVNYMALTTDVPEYLLRLGLVFQDMEAGMQTALHTINVEYECAFYSGFVFVGSKTLKVHNSWISSVSDTDCFSALGSVIGEWMQ